MNKPVQIVADIGGTHARFAYVQAGSDELLGIEIFRCSEFPFFIDAVRAYRQRCKIEVVDTFCLAVAATAGADWIDLTNNHWAFSQKELGEALNASVFVINDFDAQILSINTLSDAELQWLGSPRPVGGQVKAIIGPGTGLGVSAMTPGGEILPSEGGHIAFSPSDDHEHDLLKVLWQRYQRVSVERVLSGSGLANLYWANCQLEGYDRELLAPQVHAGAVAGDSLCLRAVEDFLAILGSVAGDVALMMGAKDGVYISGGILPRLLTFLDQDFFRQRFEQKGRYTVLCSKIPLAIVLAESPGLRGCVVALRQLTD